VKNLSIILNVILFIAVAILYALFFLKADGKESDEIKDGTSILSLDDLSIAYINSDSLLSNYDYFKDLEKEFVNKREKLEAEYRNRAQGLQQEIASFQQTANSMTINQARAVEEDLRKKQQNLMVYQEQLTQQLMQEEAGMNSDLYDKVADYLRAYGSDKNLQLVLTYAKGSGVLYANDSLNITEEVIVGLNNAYMIEKDGPAEVPAETDSAKSE
jgi:outer membrane protein